MRYEITDVTKTSLIGPRFCLTTYHDGYTSMTYAASREKLAELMANWHGRLGPKVEWINVGAAA